MSGSPPDDRILVCGRRSRDLVVCVVPPLPRAEPVSTPWVTYPGLNTASCQHGGGATLLQITSLAGTSRTRPVVNDDQEGNLGGTGPAWGYHGYEYWLALGNLLQDIVGQEAAWQSRH